MSENLKLVNLTSSSNKENPLPHKILPNPKACFRLLIFSPSNSGKSNLIKNLITRKEFGYANYYKKNIFLFSETLLVDPIWDDVDIPDDHKHSEYKDDVINNIMHFSKQTESGVMIILDDMITSSSAINSKQDSTLKRLFFQGRHYKVSIVLVSQQMKAVPLCMRINCTHLICFNLRNKKEEKCFVEENCAIDGIVEKYRAATSQQYSFLYVDKTSYAAFRNFEQELK
jgi:hypothetical protein